MSDDYPFISLEEKALKAKLQGLTVYDLADPVRPVKVFFRNPQKEIVEGDFPFLTIYFTGIARAVEREHRSEFSTPTYLPHPLTTADLDDDPDTVLQSAWGPVPYDLTFTVATHARNPMHDRQMVTSLLATEYLPFRFGWLDCDDNTTRRLDVNQRITSADFFDQSGNQIFRKEFNLLVSGEQFQFPLTAVRKPTTVTNITKNIDTEETL